MFLAGLAAIIVALLMAGAAARPMTVRSEVTPQTTCWCRWDSARQVWCYRCCDLTGCRDLYCSPAGC